LGVSEPLKRSEKQGVIDGLRRILRSFLWRWCK